MKQADVHFYFDADILGLGKVVGGLRSDCTFPGDEGTVIHKRMRPACQIMTPAIQDDVWIPAVAEQGLVIVTRDSKIQRRVAELNAVRDNSARMVALVSKDARTVWSQLEVLMIQWRRIEAVRNEPGPYIYRASRTAFKQIELPK